MARSTCDSRFSRHRVSTRCTVEGATPTCAASWTGPRRLRSRNDTIRFVIAGHVLAGIACGRLERSVIGSPAAYRPAQRFTVGHEHWNRAATSAIGTPWSTTSSSDPKPGTRSQGSVSVGHEGLLFGEVNLEQFHRRSRLTIPASVSSPAVGVRGADHPDEERARTPSATAPTWPDHQRPDQLPAENLLHRRDIGVPLA